MASEASSSTAPSAPEATSEHLSVNLQVLSPSTAATSSRPLVFPGLAATTTVRQLKEKIRQALPLKPTDAQQRLIYRGRPLAQDGDTLLTVLGEEVVSPPCSADNCTPSLTDLGTDSHYRPADDSPRAPRRRRTASLHDSDTGTCSRVEPGAARCPFSKPFWHHWPAPTRPSPWQSAYGCGLHQTNASAPDVESYAVPGTTPNTGEPDSAAAPATAGAAAPEHDGMDERTSTRGHEQGHGPPADQSEPGHESVHGYAWSWRHTGGRPQSCGPHSWTGQPA